MNLRQLFLQHLAQTSAFPLALEIERAEGMHLHDVEGKAYLDLIAGIGVSSLGHRHPAVVQAVKDQLDRYLHTLVYGEFILAPQVRLAELLAQNLPGPLDSVYFVNSGTEATEGAMKLAKRYTNRPEIVACKKAYHGSTQGAASLMWPKDFTQAYHPLLPGIRHIEYNCEWCLQRITEQTAAVVVETVQGEWGVRPPHGQYLKALRKRCDEVGALLVFDEIQAGYGRTGTLFAFEQYDVVPDILLLAKGMGGGMPIGAFVASRAIMQALSENPILGHITTFGGHPVCCAAGLATLQTLLQEDYIAQVKTKEKLFRELLQHPAIREVRSAGLWLAVELEDFDFIQQVIKICLERGLITDWFLFNNRSLRIAPPLIISEEEIRWACNVILEAIDAVYTSAT
ncbi:MAG: aminotransferase class III-fold pyridoxal phosphate-dependent enzyme [Bacteroidetes bacterium]|jgi:acetylornithine/succinyldiaminopimelate/putrescine aminotransferase|nr:aminotransferase class III-fold pyridoxal phosphate-dependent enzyme [Bacteroidota bacterium]